MIQEYLKKNVFSFFFNKKEEHFTISINEILKQLNDQLILDQNDIRALAFKAQIYYKYLLKFDEALILLKRIIEIDGENIDCRIDIVQIMIMKRIHNIEQIQSLIDECFQLDECYWRTYYIQCILYFHIERTDLGISTLNKASEVITNNHWLDLIDGQIHSCKKQNKREKAKEIADRVLKYEAKDYEMLIRLAYISINLDRTTETLLLLQKALELNPLSGKACNNYGYVLRTKKDYNKCIEFCQRAIEIDPCYLDAYYNLATCNYNVNNISECIRLYKKCIQFDRMRIGSYQELSYIFMEIIKEEKQANQYLSKFQKLFPNDEYGNNLYFLQKFRQLSSNQKIDREEAEIIQFRNLDRIINQGTRYPFITYQNSQLNFNILYSVIS